MRRLWRKPVGLLLITAGACFLNVLPSESQPPRRGQNPALEAEAAANNAFAGELFRQVGAKSGNLFCSPYSIRTALGMAEAGAAGATGAEMRKTLHLGESPERHSKSGQLAAKLAPAGEKPDYQLVVANALWVQNGFPLRDPFAALLAKDYRSEARPVDFEGDREAARQAINRWVEQQTKDRIKDLLKPNALHPETKLVLTNAIYFKGRWREQFSKGSTKTEPFFVAPGRETQVPLMRQVEDHRYFENDLLQMVRLPYERCPLEMVILLPRSKTGLPDLEKAFGAEALTDWSKQAALARVTLFLPKFKQTAEFDLGGALGALGMPTAFTNAADFSGISSARRLKIDKVVHKAFVEVDEEGTEAAAATGVTMRPTSAPPTPKKQVTLRADHPFLFIIQDRETGAVLFVGRCAEPQS